MTSIQRTGVALASFSGIALTFGLAYSVGPRSICTTGLATYVPDTPSIDDRAAELDAQKERLHRGIEFGDHLAVHLAVGTITLARATEQIEPHLRTRPEFDVVFERYYRVPSFHLGTARYLIDKVRRLLEDDPSWWLIVSTRLEAEYAAMR